MPRTIQDLHMHLNGSFTLSFLERIAARNRVSQHYLALKSKIEEYKALIQTDASQRTQSNCIALIWDMFILGSKIIQTPEDIREGTIDVITGSKASYLEIRTTPKAMGEASWKKYTESFVQGLLEANEKFSGSKSARGILSIDRCRHTPEQAFEIVDAVIAEKQRSGMLVGIDICGNPRDERKLFGDRFSDLISYALDFDIGVAIHIGEADIEQDRLDTDMALITLLSWKESNKAHSYNPFLGKVRLGHAIFLTDDQAELIRDLQIPVEVCPSCHESLGWWTPNQEHPVRKIYKSLDENVTLGTDDELFFFGDAKTEHERMKEIFPEHKWENEEAEERHQAQFGFNNSGGYKNEQALGRNFVVYDRFQDAALERRNRYLESGAEKKATTGKETSQSTVLMGMAFSAASPSGKLKMLSVVADENGKQVIVETKEELVNSQAEQQVVEQTDYETEKQEEPGITPSI